MAGESSSKILWGAKEIAKAIDGQPRQVFHLLEAGKLPGRKVGRRWVTTQAALDEFFAELNRVPK